MKNTEKVYIGKGSQIKDLDMYSVVINLDKALEHAFKYEGETYLKFTLSKTKSTDKFGRTHTAYLSVKQETKVQEPVVETKPKAKAKSKKNEPEKLEISFNNH